MAGRYRLQTLIGAGGMGQVWLARDELLDRDVAVKEIVLPVWVTDTQARDLRQQTLREARTAARLSHPHVVRIHDVVDVNGRLWIVMEYVVSRSLHDVVRRDGPLTPTAAARVGVGVLTALVAARQAGVLHNDVKPGNVLIGDDGRIVLTDFGLATFMADDGSSSRPGSLLASPHYVAPERLRGGVATFEGDLWSLGATLFAAVEGQAPFHRATTAETLLAVTGDAPGRMRRGGPLEPVIAGLLHKDPRQRWTARDTDAALRRVAHRVVATAPVVVPRPRRSPDPTVALTDSVEPRPQRPGTRTAEGRLPVQPVVSPVQPAEAVGVAQRPGRRVRMVVTALVAILSGGVATTALVHHQAPPELAGSPVPASGTAEPILPMTGGTCSGKGDETAPTLTDSRTTVPYALPVGWLWHRDPVGFQVGLPASWIRFVDDGVICFRDQDATRLLSVDPSAVVTREPLVYWQREEARLTGAGGLPGYRRTSMGVVILHQGGADWEYTWQPAQTPRQHTRRILMATSQTQAYTLSWTTREFDWSLNEPHLRRIVTSFRPDDGP